MRRWVSLAASLGRYQTGAPSRSILKAPREARDRGGRRGSTDLAQRGRNSEALTLHEYRGSTSTIRAVGRDRSVLVASVNAVLRAARAMPPAPRAELTLLIGEPALASWALREYLRHVFQDVGELGSLSGSHLDEIHDRCEVLREVPSEDRFMVRDTVVHGARHGSVADESSRGVPVPGYAAEQCGGAVRDWVRRTDHCGC